MPPRKCKISVAFPQSSNLISPHDALSKWRVGSQTRFQARTSGMAIETRSVQGEEKEGGIAKEVGDMEQDEGDTESKGGLKMERRSSQCIKSPRRLSTLEGVLPMDKPTQQIFVAQSPPGDKRASLEMQTSHDGTILTTFASKKTL